jgi:hypothetical protein
MPTPDIDRDTVPAYRQSHNPKVNACGQPPADKGESSDWRPRPDAQTSSSATTTWKRFADSIRLRIVRPASGRLEPNSELTSLAERIPQRPHATDPPVFNGDEMRPFPGHLSPAGRHRSPGTNVSSRGAPADRSASAIRYSFNYFVVSAAPRGSFGSVPVPETLDGIHVPRVVERIPEQSVECVKLACVPDFLHQRPNDLHSLVIHVRDGTNTS